MKKLSLKPNWPTHEPAWDNHIAVACAARARLAFERYYHARVPDNLRYLEAYKRLQKAFLRALDQAIATHLADRSVTIDSPFALHRPMVAE